MAGATVLGGILRHVRTITDLNLSHNGIESSGARSLGLALAAAGSIVKLNLGFNVLRDDGAAAMAVERGLRFKV